MFLYDTIDLATYPTELDMAKAYLIPFTPDELKQGVKIEVWCSDFQDVGEDFSDFLLIDQQGTTILTRRQKGY